MKNLYGWQALLLALCLLLVPLIGSSRTTASADSTPVSLPVMAQGENSVRDLRVKNTETGQISTLSLKEYLFGVLSAEMPALYHTEALKAQTVAAHSFLLYRMAGNKEDYDITDDFRTDQAFMTREQARARWGEQADEYEQKLDAVIEAVGRQVLYYDDKPALCAYTAISGGRTESSEVVWGSALPYLTPVESIGDLLCPDYLSAVAIPAEQVAASLVTPNGGSTDMSSWFSSPVYSDSGTVVSMNFGEKTLSGGQIRDALGLRSANFDVTAKDGVFHFSVRGYGHLCGMSQYGAQYMALQGSTYTEILSWYYPGCTLYERTA